MTTVDPRELTRTQLAALDLLNRFKCHRVKGGVIAGGSKVGTVTLRALQHAGLIRVGMKFNEPPYAVTGNGLATLNVHKSRKEQAHG